MAQQTHICSDITILPVVAIIFASETKPLKEVSGSARTASNIPLRCAFAAGNVAWLAIVVCVGPEPCIALILARTRLQLHYCLVRNPSIWVRTLIALSARISHGRDAFQEFFRTLRATFVDHIGKHVIWTVINALGVLQEEAALAFLAFCNQGTIAYRAIRMTLDAHRELFKCPANRLHGLEVTITTITLDQGVFATVDTVGRRIENHRASAS